MLTVCIRYQLGVIIAAFECVTVVALAGVCAPVSIQSQESMRADGYIDKRADVTAKSDAMPLSVKLDKEPVVEKPIEKPAPVHDAPSRVSADCRDGAYGCGRGALRYSCIYARGKIDDAEGTDVTPPSSRASRTISTSRGASLK